MPFSHDMAHSLATVVELVNTAPETHGEEALTDLDELADFLRRRQVSGVGELGRRDLDGVRAVRAAFHEVFGAPGRDGVIARLNALLSGARITPRLTEHDGHALHIHYFAPGSTVAEHLAAECGIALAYLLVENEWERLRSCAAPDCSHVFVDESRNRSRVYCDSRTCGNRMHVAAYRARRRA